MHCQITGLEGMHLLDNALVHVNSMKVHVNDHIGGRFYRTTSYCGTRNWHWNIYHYVNLVSKYSMGITH